MNKQHPDLSPLLTAKEAAARLRSATLGWPRRACEATARLISASVGPSVMPKPLSSCGRGHGSDCPPASHNWTPTRMAKEEIHSAQIFVTATGMNIHLYT